MTNNTPAPADLLPCPFCGGDALQYEQHEWQYYDCWSVECQTCGASLQDNTDMRVPGSSSKKDAIAAWNRRAAAITPQPAIRIEPAKPVGAACPACNGEGFGNVGCSVCGSAGRLFTLDIPSTPQPDPRDAEIERLREAIKAADALIASMEENGFAGLGWEVEIKAYRAALAKSESQ